MLATRTARFLSLKGISVSKVQISSLRFQSSAASSSLIKETASLEDFRSLVSSKKLTVTDFYATWCGPCKAVAPFLEKFSNDYENEVQFLKVDVDSAHDIAQEYGVSAMPTFILYKKGEALEKIIGADHISLKKAIEQYK